MIFSQYPIIENRVVAPRYFLLGVECPDLARESRPGQFVMVQTGKGLDPFLRRPFSLHRISPSHIEILYQVVGKGTELLSNLRPGEYIDLIGPLGKRFPHPEETQGCLILLAGGMGIAPLLAFSEELSHPPRKSPRGRSPLGKILLVYGAKTRSNLVRIDEFEKFGIEIHTITEEGRKGKRGMATDVYREILASDRQIASVYACGPRAMLQSVIQISQRRKFRLYLSLEEMMACGVGACLGCSVASSEKGYLRVCKDGPVFAAEEISLNRSKSW